MTDPCPHCHETEGCVCTPTLPCPPPDEAIHERPTLPEICELLPGALGVPFVDGDE